MEEITQEKQKHAGGRPLKFESAEEVQVLIDKYFKECGNATTKAFNKETGELVDVPAPEIPTIAGLGVALGCDRQTIYNYSDKQEFFGIIKNARDYILSKLEKKLANSSGNVGGAIFVAKNYGYADEKTIKAKLTIEDIID